MKVLLFARAKDLAGADHVDLDVPAGATVVELRQLLARRYPALGPLLEKSVLAVNGEIANDHVVLPAGAEIALLPPVSGG
jgi:molybdopterin converting factor subunit 1